jgi:signal recognition particle receptor subunit beta
MAVFNYQKKEIDAKIVYYGPGISGKTTNLQHIHQHLKPEQRGKMVSLATDEERTLFFDFLPIELESVRGFRTRFHLYTVPGQVYYGATRRAVLTGADGIIFVADSQRDRLEDNLISIKDLEENLHYYGRKIETAPLIIQYNKRDLPNVLSLEELNSKINRLNVPHFESVAILGKGVFETLTMMCRMVLKTIEDGADTRKAPQQPAAATPEAGPRRPPAEKRPTPAAPAPRPPSASSGTGLRLEGTPAKPAPPRVEMSRPAAKLSLAEKPLPALEPAATPGIALNKRPVPDSPHFESPRVPKLGQVVTPQVEEDKKKGNGKSFFSRMFGEKRPEPPEKLEAKTEPIPEEPPETILRIASCGQPRLTESGSVEIPLTLEMSANGQGKRASVNMKVAVHLDPPEVQGS